MERSAAGVARCIRLAREGQADALNELLDAYRNYVRLLAATTLRRGVRGKVDASDVVQDALLRAHQGFHQFRGTTEQEWVAWLRQILVRTLSNLHRRYATDARDVAREQSFEGDLDRSAAALREMAPAVQEMPSQEAQRRELGVLVAEGLARLDPEDREVVVLRNLHDLGWAEIAECMERSPDAVRMLWGRALRRLAGLLEERTA